MKRPQTAEFTAARALTSLQTMNKGSSSQCVEQDLVKIYEKTKTFPEKLMDILTQEEEAGNNTISWLPDGKSFIISNPLKFTLEVLPQHFKQTEFSSFTRKLYWWGFKKSSKGHECDSFHHELFSREDPYLCLKMKGRSNRTRKSKKALKAKTNELTAPKDQCSPLSMSQPAADFGCVSLKSPLTTDAIHQRMTPLLPQAAMALDPLTRLQFMQSVLMQSGLPCPTTALPLSRHLPITSQPFANQGVLPTHKRVHPNDNATQSPLVLHVHHHHIGGNTFTSVSSSPSPSETK